VQVGAQTCTRLSTFGGSSEIYDLINKEGVSLLQVVEQAS
jgi:hypothetical protein